MKIVHILNEHLEAQVADGLVQNTVYSWPEQFNVIAGKTDLPVTFFVTPTKWTLDVEFAKAREYGTFVVYFLDEQPKLDFNALTNELIIDRMIDIAVDFIGRLRLDRRIHIEDVDVATKSVYDVNNRNLTGVCVSLKLKENDGYCFEQKGVC